MAYQDDPSGADAIRDLLRRVRRLETASPLGNSSILKGQLRVGGTAVLLVDSSGGVVVHGQLNGDGTIDWTGPVTWHGLTTVDGDIDVNGTLNVDGPAGINGLFFIRGNTELTGGLTVDGGGKITVGAVTIEPGAGGTGGMSSATIIKMVSPMLWATGNLHVDGDTSVNGDETVFGAKSFGMEHPLKPGVTLRHASTESPVSGIEYWGEQTVEVDGTATVILPDYFAAIAKPDGRTVFVTGRGFVADWSEVDGDRFTVNGTPGKRFSWLVKAERFGGDFDVESPAT